MHLTLALEFPLVRTFILSYKFCSQSLPVARSVTSYHHHRLFIHTAFSKFLLQPTPLFHLFNLPYLLTPATQRRLLLCTASKDLEVFHHVSLFCSTYHIGTYFVIHSPEVSEDIPYTLHYFTDANFPFHSHLYWRAPQTTSDSTRTHCFPL